MFDQTVEIINSQETLAIIDQRLVSDSTFWALHKTINRLTQLPIDFSDGIYIQFHMLSLVITIPIIHDILKQEPHSRFIAIFQFTPNRALIYRSENHCNISCSFNLFCIQRISSVTRNSQKMLYSKPRSLSGAQIACLYAIYHKNKLLPIKTSGQACQIYFSCDLLSLFWLTVFSDASLKYFRRGV